MMLRGGIEMRKAKIFKKYNCFCIILLVFLIGLTGCSQTIDASTYTHFESEINASNLEESIMKLSSEEYFGRITGSDENLLAMDFVANSFESVGVGINESVGDYVQDYSQWVNYNDDVMVLEIVDENNNVLTAMNPYEHYREAMFFPECDNNVEGISKMVLVSDMSQFDNDESIDGKFVVIHSALITSDNLYSIFKKADEAGAVGIAYNRDNKYNDTYYVKSSSIDQSIYENGFDETNGLASFYIDNAAMGVFESAIQNNLSVHYDLDFEMKMKDTGNVIAEIKGDPGEETLILGAHLDHVGGYGDQYCPGALDNASGVASLLEISRILSTSSSVPKKNILFIAFNGEETGLRGSWYYNENPLYDIDKTAMINFDMVGSKRNVPLSIESSGFQSEEMRKEISELAKNNDIEYDSGENGRSDHYIFGLYGAESVMLINYDHTDIHTKMDTFENDIDVEYLSSILDLVIKYIDQDAY